MTMTFASLNGHPIAARDRRVIRAHDACWKKWAKRAFDAQLAVYPASHRPVD